MLARPPISLQARALRLLSQREHSRAELARKLTPHAADDDELARVLDLVAARQLQSDTRFAQSVVHRRQAQFGRRRIAFELSQHGLDAAQTQTALAGLADSEKERALRVWRKRFAVPPASIEQKAKHYRFLAQRGFEGEIISWVLAAAKVLPSD